jgi:hypothetical protein
MDPEDSLPRSQEPVTCRYPEPYMKYFAKIKNVTVVFDGN